jgi:N-acetylglucosaminyl-diphospho-decaprenol L-rhamnosyltransferase
VDDDQGRLAWLVRANGKTELIAVSIVSHGHGAMVVHLIESLLACEEVKQIIVTRNIPEALAIPDSDRIVLLDNKASKGFGENHNAAFQRCEQPYFCPLNPDIALQGNPFSVLVYEMEKSKAGIAAPLVVSPTGSVEDSVRHFPNFWSLARKILGGADGRYDLKLNDSVFSPDWVAGMCMLFRSADYARLKGFDQGYFLYYEDVDICVRAWKVGLKVIVCPSVAVVHDARRDSHRSLRHLRWHLASMGRYFFKYWGRLPRVVA